MGGSLPLFISYFLPWTRAFSPHAEKFKKQFYAASRFCAEGPNGNLEPDGRP